jgi:ribosomal-protein-alanine N-acetyltransferase
VTTPETVEVREAGRADLLEIARIERVSFPQPWPFSAFERFLGESGFLVAADGTAPGAGALDTEVVGYVVADRVPGHGTDLGHVKNLAVHPERRGEGIGRRLLADGVSVLRDAGAATVKLEVRPSNDPARDLYERAGFDFLRRVPGYYEDGEDALILVRDLEP